VSHPIFITICVASDSGGMELKMIKVKNENRNILIVAGVIVVLLIVGGIWDSQFSKAVINQNSWFATIFQAYGMFPNKLIPLISGLIIAGAALPRSNQQISKWLQIAAGLGYVWFNAVKISKEWLTQNITIKTNIAEGLPVGNAQFDKALPAVSISLSAEMIIAAIIFVVGCVLAYFWLRNKDEKQLKYLVIIAVGGIVVALVSNDYIIENMKAMWGRYRPYEIFSGAEDAYFTPWWHLNGANGHKSFPSGHSAIAAVIMYIPFFVDRNKLKLQKYATIICAVYVVTMMLTRLRLGMHHISDVTVGTSVTLITIFIVTRALNHFFIEPTLSDKSNH
jgi:membrane-associated phospholipid phosphatase